MQRRNRNSASNSIVEDETMRAYKGTEARKNKIFHGLGLLFTIYMISNIGISRFMLGAHSFDQVLYGWSYGLFFAFFLFRYARPFVQVHIRRLLENSGSSGGEFGIHDQAQLRKQTLWYVISALSCWIVVIAVSGVLYYVTATGFTYPDHWIKKIIQCNGGEDGLSPNGMFTNNAFISTGGASSLFGAYFGILLDSLYLKGTPATINKTPFWKSLLRLALSLLCVSPFTLPYILISSKKPMMIVYLFKQTVPLFFVMLILFSVTKLVHKKCKVVVDY
jgi:hypothetical protein